MKRFLFAMTLLGLCSGLQQAEARALFTRDVSGWSLGAYTNDQTGQFSHCAVSVPYRGGVIMLFSVNASYQWSMGFADTSWHLNPGAVIHMDYSIDSGRSVHSQGTVINRKLVAFPLLDSAQLFDAFRLGNHLNVSLGGRTFRFNLNNSGRALTSALECTRSYVGGGMARNEQNNPFLDGSGPQPYSSSSTPSTPSYSPPASSSNADTKSEASIVVANVLSAAGMKGFRVVPPDEVPENLRGYDAVWFAEGVAGTVNILMPDVANSTEAVSALLLAKDARACSGSFASAKPGQTEGGIVRLMTGCDRNGQITQVHYTIAYRPKGGFYVFAVLGDANTGKPAQEVEERVFDAALKVVAKR
jgi:hypothetical protein